MRLSSEGSESATLCSNQPTLLIATFKAIKMSLGVCQSHSACRRS